MMCSEKHREYAAVGRLSVLTKSSPSNKFLGPCQASTARSGLTDASPVATAGSNSAIGASAVKIIITGPLVHPRTPKEACEFSGGMTVNSSGMTYAKRHGVSGQIGSVPW